MRYGTASFLRNPGGGRLLERLKQSLDRESAMPYGSNMDLPLAVREHLPEHAQDIYREVFNHAFRAHAGEADREQRAHMIAWAAVKRSYVKADGDWVPRDA